MSDVLHDLHATHTRFGPVFVIGFARSGTSVTCRMLRRYLKVSFGTESQFIIRYLNRLESYGDLQVDANVRRLIADISTERFFTRTNRNWGFVFDPDAAFASLKARTYRDVLNAIFGQLAQHNGMVRWGDKTPQYNRDLSRLLELFPDAQFVHVVRDGRDVALSIGKTAFGPKNACEAALDWFNALNAIERFSKTVPTVQFVEVRYEDLTSEPAKVLEGLAGFLGIDDRSGDLSAVIRRRVGSDVKSNNSGKWRQALSRRDVERFEAMAGDALTRHGYALMFEGRARPVSAVERLGWRLHGRLVRMSMLSYWRDNWYKARLHFRKALPAAPRR